MLAGRGGEVAEGGGDVGVEVGAEGGGAAEIVVAAEVEGEDAGGADVVLEGADESCADAAALVLGGDDERVELPGVGVARDGAGPAEDGVVRRWRRGRATRGRR